MHCPCSLQQNLFLEVGPFDCLVLPIIYVYGIETSERLWPGLGNIGEFVHHHLSPTSNPSIPELLFLSMVTHIISGGAHGMLTHRPMQDNENCGYDNALLITSHSLVLPKFSTEPIISVFFPVWRRLLLLLLFFLSIGLVHACHKTSSLPTALPGLAKNACFALNYL